MSADRHQSLLSRHDILLGIALTAGYLATFLMPRRLDAWLAGRLAGAFMRLRRGNVGRTATTIGRGLGGRAASFDLMQVARDYYLGKFEYAVGRTRALHPGRWNPRIEVEGREYVDAALAEGHGAILWRMDMGDTLLLQRAAWQSGWPLVQLSSIIHGTKDSHLGARVVAPLFARAENAFLVERVRIPIDWSTGYLSRLVRALEANQVVAILGEVIGRQNIEVPVLAGSRPLPTGAPAIAHRTGATLIPAASFREGRWRYRVRLGPPIALDRSLPRREATEAAVREFGRRLEAAVAEHPADYNGWWLLRFPAPQTTPAAVTTEQLDPLDDESKDAMAADSAGADRVS